MWLNAHGFFDDRATPALAPFLDERSCLTAVVEDQPDQRPSGCVLAARLETITLFSDEPALTRSVDGHILIHVLGQQSEAVPGDRVRACGSLSVPSSPRIPGVFDYAAFLANHAVEAILYTGGPSFQIWGNSGRFRLQRWGWQLKQCVVRRFENALAPEQAAVMAGLVVGQRPRFHPELKEIFLRSGTMHVLVASGSNVAFVMLMWFIALRCLRVPNRWALATSLAPVWIYTLVSGGDAPIVRAAVMGSALTIAHLLRRWDKAFNALGIAAWIILIANPRSIFDVGFQMSFMTVTGLMLVTPWVENFIADARAAVKWIARVFAASLTAQAWLIPVSVHSFGHVYIWSIFSNMAVVPMAGLGLPLGVAVVCWTGLGPVVQWYASALLWTVKTMATYLGARTWIAPFSPVVTAGYYLVCFSIVRVRERTMARACVAVGVTLMAAGWITATASKTTPQPLTLTWIDTGRALATLVEDERRERFLLLPQRAEQDQSLERIVLPFLTSERRRPISGVMVEHELSTGSVLGAELLRACSVSTVTVCAAPLIWVRRDGHNVLLASVFTLRLQRWLIDHARFRPDVIAAHFPPRWKWDPMFVARFKPSLVIETGSPRRNAEVNTPWPHVPVVIPQKQGWYQWSASTADVKISAAPT